MRLATLSYIRMGDKTLMLHRNKDPSDFHYGKYVVPGGKFEPEECPEECVKRETTEETGLELINPTLKGILTLCNQNTIRNDSAPNNYMVFAFLSRNFTGTLRQPEEGDLLWISNAEIQNLPLWEGDRLFFPWLERESIFSAKLIYEDKELVDHQAYFY